MSFLALIYLGGLISSRVVGMPALVGEICVGILLGPNLAIFPLPSPETFVLLGQIGCVENFASTCCASRSIKNLTLFPFASHFLLLLLLLSSTFIYLCECISTD
jgi:hypothetical protein